MARSTPLSPALFLAGANMMLGLPFRFPGGLGSTLGLPWSAEFVSAVGYWTHYDARVRASSWPLPMTADCNALWRAAERARVGSTDLPEAGEIFLMWSADQGRFVHSGIVLGVGSWIGTQASRRSRDSRLCVTTIEGNVKSDGRLGGPEIRVLERRLAPERGDRFIRWVDLDGRGRSAEVSYDRFTLYKDICVERMARSRYR